MSSHYQIVEWKTLGGPTFGGNGCGGAGSTGGSDGGSVAQEAIRAYEAEGPFGFKPRIRPASDFQIKPRVSWREWLRRLWNYDPVAMQAEMLKRVWALRPRLRLLNNPSDMQREIDRIMRIWATPRHQWERYQWRWK